MRTRLAPSLRYTLRCPSLPGAARASFDVVAQQAGALRYLSEEYVSSCVSYSISR